jgi:hypothetical protein
MSNIKLVNLISKGLQKILVELRVGAHKKTNFL